MTDRRPRLPPLNALRVFQAVMQHRSLRAAADDLHVSPQAVSLQIKGLEEALSVPLFTRKGRSIDPSEQAILLAHFVNAGFAEIEEGVRRITRSQTRNRINVNASPYFATRHLLDRLAQFRAILPDADLRLTTMVDLPDFARDDVDVAIQWGFGDWAPHDHSLLLRDLKVICCTPDIARHLQQPADLLDQTLLHPILTDRLWSDILSHLGVTLTAQTQAIRFQDAATMRRATLAGLGIGLISSIDAAEDLESGRLVAPFGTDVMATMPASQIPGFYLVLPRSHRRVRPIAAFCDWIMAEDWTADSLTLPAKDPTR
jgi:LysR family transcriptional regulator, glycine cleavage system transcriptional activator